ncbi:phosphonate ABC transporter, permease protein PhnE [Evansella tamaricis]|uniref:Phosphonate ABC transporter, permease protein PhnE n=1 Tax=Evansella tamaricis TaxID=2069301 RepID=A0ABS6JCZ1_9BACI|nr:phosphonate ABC transporter, permease protein PhnE [Evansella tamaricis]MBU9710300.1 phosphonate ABC transporter, permease protein PhnE [Evansella tamaricis]
MDKSKRIPIIPARQKLFFAVIIAIVIGLYYLASIVTSSSPIRLVDGIPHIFSFVFDDLIPPNWSYYNRVLPPLLETWNIAFLSTTVAVIFCLPISFLAAGNINKKTWLYQIVRLALNVLRTIPDMILAVIFVAMVGIGALAGVYALFFFSLGILVKLISETVEAIDPGPLEAIRATGGNIFQIIWFGAMPQILPQYVSYSLYVLEINVRASLVLGFVGAGGIGLILRQQMSMFNYGNIAMIIFITFIAVTIIDTVSTSLRKRLV